ncbi:SDR family oxidoreductase [Photorhabdus sp. P32]|uniref:SDR family oxidoreductase n=1 Tax=Photorhabdus sp. P32 TaxID=3117549 RepID=UPI00311B0CF5
MFRLSGKYTLITGGTTGIGFETAKKFHAEGAHVAITGNNPQTLDFAQRFFGKDVWVIPSDAGSLASQVILRDTIKERWPQIDALFLNAGIVTSHKLEEESEEGFDRLMSINLKGPFFLLQSMLPLLARPSSIILSGSVSGHIGKSGTSATYSASKGALLAMGRALAAEFVDRQIRVNSISPGPIMTPAFDKLGINNTQRVYQEVSAMIPAGHLGTPADVADVAVFLASDESKFLLGTDIIIDGGMVNI